MKKIRNSDKIPISRVLGTAPISQKNQKEDEILWVWVRGLSLLIVEKIFQKEDEILLFLVFEDI